MLETFHLPFTIDKQTLDTEIYKILCKIILMYSEQRL